MKLNQTLLRPEARQWVRDGLITEENAERLLQRYPLSGRNIWLGVFAVIGCLLCLAGIILLIAHNWQGIAPLTKLGTLLALLAGSAVLGVETQRCNAPRAWWECGYFALSLFPLLGLMLVSQIFHVSGDPTLLFLIWAIVIAPLPFLTGSISSYAMWLIATFAVLVCVCSEDWLDLPYTKNHYYAWLFVIWGAVCAVGSAFWGAGRYRPQRYLGQLIGFAVSLSAVYVLGFMIDEWFAAWLVLFVYAMALIWYGFYENLRRLVDLGLAFVMLTILSVFIRLVDDMLNTGLIFVGGGLLILCGVIAFYYIRRTLMRRMLSAASASSDIAFAAKDTAAKSTADENAAGADSGADAAVSRGDLTRRTDTTGTDTGANSDTGTNSDAR